MLTEYWIFVVCSKNASSKGTDLYSRKNEEEGEEEQKEEKEKEEDEEEEEECTCFKKSWPERVGCAWKMWKCEIYQNPMTSIIQIIKAENQ